MAYQSLTYTSWASPGTSAADLARIVASSQVNNGPLELTGFLVFNGAAYLQILEGPRQALDLMLDRLRRDDRHWDVVVRDEREISSRAFPDWTMAFLNISCGRVEGVRELTAALQRHVPQEVRDMLVAIARSLADHA